MFTIDYEKLHSLESAFIIYEIASHGVDPRESLEETTFRIKKKEGYKQGAFDELHGMLVNGGPYTDILLKGFEISNLASYRQKPNIEKIAASDDAELLETALANLYEGDDDESAFNDLVSIIGGNFDVLGLIFFIKDCEKYLPIRSDTFDERFREIGVDSKLSHNCTWEKYQDYNETIKEIQRDLKKNINSKITIIDAHSFVWVLNGVAEYTRSVKQPVEHKTLGKGVIIDSNDETITVKFANSKNPTTLLKSIAIDGGKLTFINPDFDIDAPNKSEVNSDLNSVLAKTGGDEINKYFVIHSNKGKDEYKNGYLRAGLHDKNGKPLHYWDTLSLLKPGDILFHYSGGFIMAISTVTSNCHDIAISELPGQSSLWGDVRRQVDYKPFTLDEPIKLSDYKDEIIKYKKDKYSAFNKNGGVVEGYVHELEPEIAALFEKAIGIEKASDKKEPDTHATGTFASWTIENDELASKLCDKSFFEYHGSGVPREIYWFFNAEEMTSGSRKDIELEFNGQIYDAYLKKETHELGRIQVFWYQDLADEFEDYYTPNNYPVVSFEKIGNDQYRLSFDVGEKTSADEELESLIVDRPDIALNDQIDEFLSHFDDFKESEERNEKLRKKFVDDFSIDAILTMTMDQYVIGKGTKDTFCYRIENELRELGDMHGATSFKFGMYYGKQGADTSYKYRVQKKFGEDPEEALEIIKGQIVDLIMAGEEKDYDAIRGCELWPLYRGKILSTYHPNDYLAIFINEHLDYFIAKLGLDLPDGADVLEKQNCLVEWKQKIPRLKDMSLFLFDRFLYSTFGRPLDEMNADKEMQAQRDREYPKKFAVSIKIKQSEWFDLLNDPGVFYDSDIELLKKIYLEDNHATTLYDLSIKDGVSPSSYISPVVNLAKRISRAAKLEPITRDNGSRVWWRIPFWGRTREDGHFEWKLRPDLAKALVRMYPELDLIVLNEEEDEQLISDLKQSTMLDATEDFEYAGGKKKKSAPQYTNGRKTYPRDRQTAINALAHAHFKCEVDKNHPTFIRRRSDRPYTEPHHLVPMSFSDQFDVSLDREENIVSLCSNCHNHIHYGKDAEQLIQKLYEDRKDLLESIGVSITLDELLEMYGIRN